MNNVQQCIVVEGRADALQIAPLVSANVQILRTNGTMSEVALEQLIEPYDMLELFTLFDADYTGDQLRQLMDRLYPECTHILIDVYDKEVERTPRRKLKQLLLRATVQVKD